MLSGPPVSVSVAPTHSGPLFDALAVGLAFTVTVVVTVSLHPLPAVTVRV